MNIWNKVFLGVIFFAAIGVALLGAVERHIRNTGQKRVAELEQRIEDTDDKIKRIKAGTDPLNLSVDKPLTGLSIEELRGILREHYQERGRAWFGCTVDNLASNTLPPALEQAEAQVVLTSPLIPDDTGALTKVAPPDTLRGVVYVFQEGISEKGDDETEPTTGKFLARFSVRGTPVPRKFRNENGDEIDGWRVSMVTADPVSDTELDQIFAATGTNVRWAIYLTPPIDRVAGVINQLTEEEKKTILEKLLEKFQPRDMPELTDENKDGVDSAVLGIWERYRAQWDDPEAESANDFSTLLDWLYRQRADMLRAIKDTEADIAMFKTSEANLKAEAGKLETQDIPLEVKRVAAMETQRDAVKDILEQYTAEADSSTLKIEKLQELMKMYTFGITEAHIKAAERIEDNVRKAAQEQEQR